MKDFSFAIKVKSNGIKSLDLAKLLRSEAGRKHLKEIQDKIIQFYTRRQNDK